jgi:ERCC4-type nuclease
LNDPPDQETCLDIVDIVADVRERPSETFSMLEHRPDVAVTVATLEFGDYSIARQVAFERKTAEDLGRSIIDGRLFRQMSKLRRLADRPVLLVEGLEPQTAPSGVPWSAVRGALVSVAVVFGVPVLIAPSADESAEMIVAAGRQLARATSLGYARPGYRPRGWRRRSSFILQGLPNVGPARARALLDKFESVRRVMSADLGELAEVDGIGKTVAASILRAIGLEPEPAPEPQRLASARRNWRPR